MEIIENKDQLIRYFEAGSKSSDRWGIGTEHEQFLFLRDRLERAAYGGTHGIAEIMQYMQKADGWKPVTESGNIIALRKNGASITIEPGGQFELSGSNFKTVHETNRETRLHFDMLKNICKEFGVGSLCLGFDPLSTREQVPWMPKKRYEYMRNYMPTRGTLGLDMMTRTACIQVNLDYGNEQDMVKKMRVAQAFQPVITAIFANSPFTEGKPNGYLSYRARVWDDTDPDRCGFLPLVFEEGFGFERWVDYLLDVPMYFIYRDGEYLSSGNITFRQFLNGEHELKPTMEDWDTHVSTVFPDVRLKRFIELRGADAGCINHIVALSALWVGLMYDEQSLEEAWSIASQWNLENLKEIRSQVPKLGLRSQSGNLNMLQISREVVRMASEGLTRRAKLLGIEDEGCYLHPVKRIVDSGITQAEQLLEKYHTLWKQDVSELIKDCPGTNDK
ncbi:glutamate--cysteine ligase [Alkalitalea saponilacus]|uniref:Glutamate--cysteine ligase n=1 Tax=Alkalitalea saponilacus TaxID=889453 RepID=A0A1T5HSH0_9BACT|nr:glutamate--cysteine ligase [Alkalitalea saponilacus]ASB47717.1 glutamate--cysteine ligase [Alkalitalea saponilacus]SKC23644.1 glutamate--cysteine ligase [Alkalitalea saponilacus]